MVHWRLRNMICVTEGVAAFWLILLLSSCPPLRLVIPAFAQLNLHCVELGQSSVDGKYTSIGASRFKPKDLNLLGPFHYGATGPEFPVFLSKLTNPNWRSLTCPEGFDIYWDYIYKYHFIDYCPKDIDIRAYLVRQNGRVLRGWLHFEIELTDQTDEMEWIYVQLRDEYFDAVGEFVADVDVDEQCRSSKEGLISPSKYQFLPCSVVSLREAKVSQGMFVAKRSQYEKPVDDKYLPKEELKRGIHFTWRLNEYWCNKHLRFRLDAHVWTTKNMTTYRKSTGLTLSEPFLKFCTNEKNKYCRQRRKVTDYWIHPKWFGAADIKTHGPLDCTTPAIDFRSGALSPEAGTWLGSSTKMTVGTDYETPENVQIIDGDAWGYVFKIYRYKNCQVMAGPKAPSFGGRCEHHYDQDKSTSKDFFQGCNTNENATEFAALNISEFVPYSKYVEDINTKRLNQCKQTCEEPDINNPKDLEDIKSYPMSNGSQGAHKPPVHFRTLQDARLEVRANTFFQTRKFHGNICIFITMFLLPVSNFLIRYYKETFMHQLSLGCPPWFWFHLFVCFAVPTMYRSSWSAMQESINNYGTSKSAHGIFHRTCGYFFVIVFLLMVVLGGIRPVFRGSRLACMSMHSITGFLLYFLAIILVINSTYIPASPTVHECDPKENLPTGFSFTAKMTSAWFLVDLLFHLLLTVAQFYVDKKCQINRSGFGLPFVPMLPAEARGDLKDSKFRKIVFLVYVSLSLVMTFTTIAVNFRNDDQGNCVLGNMTCDLNQFHPDKTSSPFGCSSVSLRYYAKVFAKYSITFNGTDLVR